MARAETTPRATRTRERRRRRRRPVADVPLALQRGPTAGVVVRRTFDPHRPEWLSAMAGSAADPDVVQRAAAYLATLQALADALGRATTLEQLIDVLLSTILDATGALRVAVLIQRSGEVELAAVRARSDQAQRAAVTPNHDIVLDVLENGVSVMLDRLPTCDAPDAAISVCSAMCAPLRTAADVLGALYVESDGPNRFDRARLDLLSAIGMQAGIAVHRARLLRDNERLFYDVIRAIASTVDARDGYTHHHSERVAALAGQIARELGWSDTRRQVVHLAALMHDVGKIAVRDDILNKPSPLTPEEFADMRRHPEHGARILAEIHSPRIAAIVPAVKHHHEKWDGTGYPDGLAGDRIPPASRVLGVADYLDALTSARTYKAATPLHEAITMAEAQAGTAFDPEVVAAVRRLYERGELA